MASKAVSLVVVTILLSAVIVGAMGVHDAEAKSIKQSPTHKYSKWYSNKVCGDQLCEGTPVYKVPTKLGRSVTWR